MTTKDELTLRVPASCRPGEKDRTKRQFSESVEEYIDGIYRLQHEFESVQTGHIATYMFVSPGSATTMVKRLAELGLVHHVPYQGIRLTDYGMKVAKQLTRAHRVLKSFLHDELGLPWNDLHELACKLEHYIGEDIINRMWDKMGQPIFDPQGAPIDPDLEDPSRRLQEIEPGEFRVYRVTDERVEFLAHLEEIGLVPRKKFRAISATKIDSLINLEIDGRTVTVGKEVARHVWVVPEDYKWPGESGS